MAVTRNDLTAFEGGPDIFFDGLIRRFLPDFSLHFAKPKQNFLVCQAMEWARETIESGTIGEERI